MSQQATRHLTPEQKATIHHLVKTVDLNPFIPCVPTPKQARFLSMTCREAFYGGAGFGGKTHALLMAALQYVHLPYYNAIVFRRTFTDLIQADSILERARAWAEPAGARWNGSARALKFPSGAILSFGFMETASDRYRYQGPTYHFVGWDEVTQIPAIGYRHMFGWLRRREDEDIPLRVRSASNPGGPGHDWVKMALVDNPTVPFMPARIDDNPYADQAEYEQSLEYLDPVTRAQIRYGDWTARSLGGRFRREWFEITEDSPREAKSVRFWDLAATEPKKGRDPDWTAGAKMCEKDGVFWVQDMRRAQGTPADIEALVKQTAQLDGKQTRVVMEQEPGSSGKSLIDHFARKVLQGYEFSGKPSTGSKEARAMPFSAAAQNGNVRIVSGPWVMDFLDEIEAFPGGAHDDQVDAVSGAHGELATGAPEDFIVGAGRSAPAKTTDLRLSEGRQQTPTL